MNELTFMQPLWLIALLAIPIFTLAGWASHRSRGKTWQAFVAPRLRKKLSSITPSWQFWSSLITGLLGLVFLILALARPIAGKTETETVSKGRNIILLIDSSRSMRVQDVQPSRLEVARTIAFECIDSMPQDRIGIIAFASEPFMLTPLTIDHGIAKETIEQLNHESIPEGGSNMAAAVEKAIDVLKETGQSGNAIVLMSDGEDHDSNIAKAGRKAADENIPILSIGIAKEQGDLIPDKRDPSGYFIDQNGQRVLSRLDEQTLRSLSRESQGIYIQEKNMNNAAQLILSSLAGIERVSQGSRTESVPNDRFQWFLFPSIILFITSMLVRTRFKQILPPAVAATAFLLGTQNIQADLSQAQKLYSKGNFSDAVSEYTDEIHRIKDVDEGYAAPFKKSKQILNSDPKDEDLPNIYFARGTALFQAGDLNSALTDFSQSLLSSDKTLQTESHYSLGNTLAQIGNGLSTSDVDQAIATLKDAITHYDSALELKSDHTAAQKNRKTVTELLAKLEQQKNSDNQQNEEEKKQDEESSEKEEKEDSKDSKDGKDGEKKDADEQKKEDQEGEKDNETQNQENGQPDENSEESDNAAEQQNQDNTEEQKNAQEQQTMQQREIQLAPPNADETAEEYAMRILMENADLEKTPKRRSTLQPHSKKNW